MFLLFKLPAAYICGVRVRELNERFCSVSVKHRWINQNPFKSIYFAVLAMAAEMSTGAIVLANIKKSGRKVSMLVTANRATFNKKATGRITFKCSDGKLVSDVMEKAIITGEAQVLWLKSIGTDENENQVTEMEFEWSIKLKV